MKYLYVIILTMLLSSCNNWPPKEVRIKEGRKLINAALKMPTSYDFVAGHEIKTEDDAIEFAEPILFGIFGEDDIKHEKPYSVDLVDGYWILEGNLPRGYHGGTFEIIFSVRNGRVIYVSHGK